MAARTVGPASVTLIVAAAVGPLNPPTALVVDSWTLKLPPAKEPVRRREFQAGRGLSPGDKTAACDRCCAIILVERSAGDVRNLEVCRRAVADSGFNDQSGSRLRSFGRPGGGNARSVKRDGDRGPGRRAAQSAYGIGRRFPDRKATRDERCGVGVNFRPASPWAAVINWPLVICVTPSFRKSVPPVMRVIWK